MVKACITFFRKSFIARLMCVLLLTLSLSFLTACSNNGEDNDLPNEPGRASSAEQSMKGCWMCSIFDATMSAGESVALGAIPSVAGGGISLIAVGYGLWLAIYIMKYAASMKEPDVAEFWKTMATQAFWVAMGAALLFDLKSGGKWSAVNAFAKPVFNAFVDAGLMIGSGVGGPGPGSGMTAIVAAIQEKLNFGTSIAMTVIFSPSLLIPMAPLIAVICLVTSVILMLWIPTLLLICSFRYGVALFTLPLAVGAYVFKPTRAFTGKVAKMYVEIGFAIMGMCAYSACCTQIIQIYIDRYAPYVKDPSILFNDVKQTLAILTGPGVTGLLFLAFFLVMYAEVALDLFAGFASGVGGMSGAGKQMQGVAKGAAGLAKTAVAFGIKRHQRKKDKKVARDLAKYDKFKDRKGTAGYRHYQENLKKAQDRGLVDEKGNTTKKFASVARGSKDLLAMRRADLTRQNAALKGANVALKGKNAALDRLYDAKNKNMKGPFKGIRRGINNIKKNAQKLHNNMSRVGNNLQRLGNWKNKVDNSIRNTALGRAAGAWRNVASDLKAAHQTSFRASLNSAGNGNGYDMDGTARDDKTNDGMIGGRDGDGQYHSGMLDRVGNDLANNDEGAKRAGVGMARKLDNLMAKFGGDNKGGNKGPQFSSGSRMAKAAKAGGGNSG